MARASFFAVKMEGVIAQSHPLAAFNTAALFPSFPLWAKTQFRSYLHSERGPKPRLAVHARNPRVASKKKFADRTTNKVHLRLSLPRGPIMGSHLRVLVVSFHCNSFARLVVGWIRKDDPPRIRGGNCRRDLPFSIRDCSSPEPNFRSTARGDHDLN